MDFAQCSIAAIASANPVDRAKAFYKLAHSDWSKGGMEMLKQSLTKSEPKNPKQQRMPTAACGAFVHGCEDEFELVRKAAVDSLCTITLATKSPAFASSALDCLVDMFNDEMFSVRVAAITNIKRIATHFPLILNVMQLTTMLLALDAVNLNMRHLGYDLLGLFRLVDLDSLKRVIMHLYRNLKRFPGDLPKILVCFRDLGMNHPGYVEEYKDRLLKLDNRYLPQEVNLDSLTHIANLILIFNAGFSHPTILESMPNYTFRQVYFLNAKYPQCFPKMEDFDHPMDHGQAPNELMNPTSMTTLSNMDFVCETFNSVTRDAQDLLTGLEFRACIEMLDGFGRQLHKICRLEPDMHMAVFAKGCIQTFKLTATIQSLVFQTTETRSFTSTCIEQCAEISRTCFSLFNLTRALLSVFLGLEVSTSRALVELGVLAQAGAAFAAVKGGDGGLEYLNSQEHVQLINKINNGTTAIPPTTSDTSAVHLEILKSYISSYKLPKIQVARWIRFFNGTVTCTVEHGLPATLECAQYIPVPVQFEGSVQNWRRSGGSWKDGSVAVLVELSNLKQIVVPLDSECLEPVGTYEARFSFSTKLVLGDSKYVKCKLIQSHDPSNLPASMFEEWTLRPTSALFTRAVCHDSTCASVLQKGETWYPYWNPLAQ
ncbi:Integrator complex subunit 4 [Chytriomyces hyalinus]|nr:Integrator complex subunit 4 [Chytriomyces hyalinus]